MHHRVFIYLLFFKIIIILSGVFHSVAAGKNCAGTSEMTGLGGEADVLLRGTDLAEILSKMFSHHLNPQ